MTDRMQRRTDDEGDEGNPASGEGRTPPVAYMEAIGERYRRLGYEPYRWYRADDAPPLAALPRPMEALRLGVLTTSGAYVPGQRGFHYRDDTSVRAIASDTPNERIHFAHVTENYLEDPRRDPGCIVPLAALRTLVSEGLLPAPGARGDDAGGACPFPGPGGRRRSPGTHVTGVPSDRESDRTPPRGGRHPHAVPGQRP